MRVVHVPDSCPSSVSTHFELKLKADRPHPHDYSHTPTDYRHTHKQTDRLMDATIRFDIVLASDTCIWNKSDIFIWEWYSYDLPFCMVSLAKTGQAWP